MKEFPPNRVILVCMHNLMEIFEKKIVTYIVFIEIIVCILLKMMVFTRKWGLNMDLGKIYQ